MKRSLLAAALLAATATTGLAASVPSKPVTLRTAGYWSAWYIDRNSAGEPMCGMQSGGDTGSGTASLMFKYSPGGQLLVHVFKNGWRIPNGTIVSVAIIFDSGTPWVTNDARGSMSSTGSGLVEFEIRSDSAGQFLAEFGDANAMKLQFTQGTEQPWTFNMIGSREVSTTFAQCVVAVAKPSSQPYGNSGARTQPYGKTAPPQKSTQPFGAQPKQPLPVPAPKADDGGI